MNFGDNLKKLRKSKNMSQECLAEKLNVSRQAVSKWETKEAYPEMNNILELCKIFHCHISDLINDNIIDINSLDEITKEKIVKLQYDEQKKIKALSKVISIMATIGKIVCKISLPIILIILIITPFILINIEVNNNELIWHSHNNNLTIKTDNNNIIIKYQDEIITKENIEMNNLKYIEIWKNNSKFLIISYIEIGFLTLAITLFLMIHIFTSLEQLFINIQNEKSPFTIENTRFIRKIAYNMIIVTIIPNIGGIIFKNILNANINIDFELFDLVQILFLFSMVYIFKYGYQLQIHSNGKMYDYE